MLVELEVKRQDSFPLYLTILPHITKHYCAENSKGDYFFTTQYDFRIAKKNSPSLALAAKTMPTGCSYEDQCEYFSRAQESNKFKNNRL